MEQFENLKTNEKLIFFSLLIIPFMKGLFFKEVFLPVFIIYSLILFIYILKLKSLFLDSRLLILFIIQIVIGIGSTIFGINREGALYGLFLLLFPVLVYFLIFNIIKDYYNFIYLSLFAVFISGVAISIINYLMELRFNNTDILIRFTWVIPYANTLAVYLFASSIAGLYLLIKKEFEIKIKAFVISGICLNISGLVFTYSRTMIILAVILYIIFLLLQKSKKNIEDFIFIFTLSGLSVIIYSYFKWKSFFIILILYLSLAYLYERYFLNLLRKSKTHYNFNKKLLFFLIPIIILLILASVPVLKSTGIYSRLQTISSNDQTLLERFSYYMDSIKIIRDFPIFGIGPGGWPSIMYKYQTAVYFPTFVHSSIVQTVLNYGIFGLMIFMMQIIVFIIYFINAFRNKTNIKYRNEIICLFIINLSIILHSIIDIDFEFQIINLLFWSNFVFISLLSRKRLGEFQFGKLKKSAFSFVLIVLVFLAFSTFVSNAFYLKGLGNFDNQNYFTAEEFFNKAIKFNYFSNSSYFMKGSALEEIFLKNQDKNTFEEAVENIGTAEKLDRFNPLYLDKEADIFFKAGNYNESTKKYEELLILQPLKLANYEVYSTSLLKKAEQEIKTGNVNQEKADFNKIIQIESRLKEINNRLSPYALKLKHKPELTFSPKLSYNISEVYYYLHAFSKARYYAEKALTDYRYTQKISELKSRFEKHN